MPDPRPYLGQMVHFWDSMLPRLDGQQHARIAIVASLCSEPGFINLTVFNDPEHDVRLQGMTPIRSVLRVPFANPDPKIGNGWRTFCHPMPSEKSALRPSRIPVAGTIGTSCPPVDDGGEMTPANGTERRIEPIDDGAPIEVTPEARPSAAQERPSRKRRP